MDKSKNDYLAEITKGCGAIGAGADGAEVFVAEDASVVAIVEIDLHGVIADLGGGLGAHFGFVHGQGGRGDGSGFGAWMFLLEALVVAGGAGAFIAEIRKIVMAGVIVGPGDIDARTAGDVDFYV